MSIAEQNVKPPIIGCVIFSAPKMTVKNRCNINTKCIRKKYDVSIHYLNSPRARILKASIFLKTINVLTLKKYVLCTSFFFT